MNARALGAFIFGTCACFAAGAQTLYKCVQPNGRIVYQDARCPDDAKQSSIRAPDAIPDAPAAVSDTKVGGKAAAKPNPQAELEAVIETLANFQACNEAVPGFATKYGTAYSAWKQTNKEALIRYGQNEAARAKMTKNLEEQRQQLGAEDADGRAKFAATCDREVGPQVAASSAR